MSAHATAPEPHDSSHGQAVAVAHISNALGTVTPVKEIVEMTHRLGCWCGDLRPSLPTQKAPRITAVPPKEPHHGASGDPPDSRSPREEGAQPATRPPPSRRAASAVKPCLPWTISSASGVTVPALRQDAADQLSATSLRQIRIGQCWAAWKKSRSNVSRMRSCWRHNWMRRASIVPI